MEKQSLVCSFIFHFLLVKYVQKTYEGNKITGCLNESKKYELFLVNMFLTFKATVFRGIPSPITINEIKKRTSKMGNQLFLKIG